MKLLLSNANGQWTGEADVIPMPTAETSDLVPGLEPLRRDRNVAQTTPPAFAARIRLTFVELKLPDLTGEERVLRLDLTSEAPIIDCVINVPEPVSDPVEELEAVTAALELEIPLDDEGGAGVWPSWVSSSLVAGTPQSGEDETKAQYLFDIFELAEPQPGEKVHVDTDGLGFTARKDAPWSFEENILPGRFRYRMKTGEEELPAGSPEPLHIPGFPDLMEGHFHRLSVESDARWRASLKKYQKTCVDNSRQLRDPVRFLDDDDPTKGREGTTLPLPESPGMGLIPAPLPETIVFSWETNRTTGEQEQEWIFAPRASLFRVELRGTGGNASTFLPVKSEIRVERDGQTNNIVTWGGERYPCPESPEPGAFPLGNNSLSYEFDRFASPVESPDLPGNEWRVKADVRPQRDSIRTVKERTGPDAHPWVLTETGPFLLPLEESATPDRRPDEPEFLEGAFGLAETPWEVVDNVNPVENPRLVPDINQTVHARLFMIDAGSMKVEFGFSFELVSPEQVEGFGQQRLDNVNGFVLEPSLRLERFLPLYVEPVARPNQEDSPPILPVPGETADPATPPRFFELSFFRDRCRPIPDDVSLWRTDFVFVPGGRLPTNIEGEWVRSGLGVALREDVREVGRYWYRPKELQWMPSLPLYGDPSEQPTGPVNEKRTLMPFKLAVEETGGDEPAEGGAALVFFSIGRRTWYSPVLEDGRFLPVFKTAPQVSSDGSPTPDTETLYSWISPLLPGMSIDLAEEGAEIRVQKGLPAGGEATWSLHAGLPLLDELFALIRENTEEEEEEPEDGSPVPDEAVGPEGEPLPLNLRDWIAKLRVLFKLSEVKHPRLFRKPIEFSPDGIVRDTDDIVKVGNLVDNRQEFDGVAHLNLVDENGNPASLPEAEVKLLGASPDVEVSLFEPGVDGRPRLLKGPSLRFNIDMQNRLIPDPDGQFEVEAGSMPPPVLERPDLAGLPSLPGQEPGTSGFVEYLDFNGRFTSELGQNVQRVDTDGQDIDWGHGRLIRIPGEGLGILNEGLNDVVLWSKPHMPFRTISPALNLSMHFTNLPAIRTGSGFFTFSQERFGGLYDDPTLKEFRWGTGPNTKLWGFNFQVLELEEVEFYHGFSTSALVGLLPYRVVVKGILHHKPGAQVNLADETTQVVTLTMERPVNDEDPRLTDPNAPWNGSFDGKVWWPLFGPTQDFSLAKNFNVDHFMPRIEARVSGSLASEDPSPPEALLFSEARFIYPVFDRIFSTPLQDLEMIDPEADLLEFQNDALPEPPRALHPTQALVAIVREEFVTSPESPLMQTRADVLFALEEPHEELPGFSGGFLYRLEAVQSFTTFGPAPLRLTSADYLRIGVLSPALFDFDDAPETAQPLQYNKGSRHISLVFNREREGDSFALLAGMEVPSEARVHSALFLEFKMPPDKEYAQFMELSRGSLLIESSLNIRGSSLGSPPAAESHVNFLLGFDRKESAPGEPGSPVAPPGLTLRFTGAIRLRNQLTWESQALPDPLVHEVEFFIRQGTMTQADVQRESGNMAYFNLLEEVSAGGAGPLEGMVEFGCLANHVIRSRPDSGEGEVLLRWTAPQMLRLFSKQGFTKHLVIENPGEVFLRVPREDGVQELEEKDLKGLEAGFSGPTGETLATLLEVGQATIVIEASEAFWVRRDVHTAFDRSEITLWKSEDVLIRNALPVDTVLRGSPTNLDDFHPRTDPLLSDPKREWLRLPLPFVTDTALTAEAGNLEPLSLVGVGGAFPSAARRRELDRHSLENTLPFHDPTSVFEQVALKAEAVERLLPYTRPPVRENPTWLMFGLNSSFGSAAQPDLPDTELNILDLNDFKWEDIDDPYPSGNTTEDGGVFSVTAGGDTMVGVEDKFHFVHGFFCGDGEITVKVNVDDINSDKYEFGIMFRETAAKNSRYAAVYIAEDGTGPKTLFSYRSSTGAYAAITSTATAYDWFKLVRCGQDVSGYGSDDGEHWVLIGAINFGGNLPEEVRGGIFGDNEDSNNLANADFSQIRVHRAPAEVVIENEFDSCDIGNVVKAGSYSESDGVHTLEGSGDDIWNQADAFRYTFRELPLLPVDDVLEGFGYRRSLTANTSLIDADLTDFPMLVKLTLADLKSSSNGGKIQHPNSATTGIDLAFTADDGLTHLDYQLEHYDENTGEIVAWVRVPNLSDNAGAPTVIYMYYGHPDQYGFQNPNDVWDSNYKGVWHLNETGNSNTDGFVDSTLNNNNGTGVNLASGDSTDGKTGKAIDFAGDSYIKMPDNSSLEPPHLTLSAWIKPDTWSNNFAVIASKEQGSSPYPSFDFRKHPGTSKIEGVVSVYNGVYTATGGSVSTGQWQYVAMTYDGETLRIYNNGVKTGYNLSPSGDIKTGPTEFRIANHPETSGRKFDGRIDEVRLSSVARSDAWIKTEYNNQNDPANFLDLGTEEEIETPCSGTNDFSISAMVTPIVETDFWNKFGVMLRDSLEKDARHVSLFRTRYDNNQLQMSWRTAGGGTSQSFNFSPIKPWIKLEKRRDLFRVYSSADGRVWKLQHSETLPDLFTGDKIYLGLGVTAHNTALVAKVDFEDVRLARLQKFSLFGDGKNIAPPIDTICPVGLDTSSGEVDVEVDLGSPKVISQVQVKWPASPAAVSYQLLAGDSSTEAVEIKTWSSAPSGTTLDTFPPIRATVVVLRVQFSVNDSFCPDDLKVFPGFERPLVQEDFQSSEFPITGQALHELLALSATTAKNILFITSDAGDSGDGALIQTLRDAGFNIILRRELETTSLEARQMQMIYISALTDHCLLPDDLPALPVPVMCSNHRYFSALGLTGDEEGTDFGQSDLVSKIAFLENPVVSDFTENDDLFLEDGLMNYGVPGEEAIVIGEGLASPIAPVLFAYESGVRMVVNRAPARRLAFFAPQPDGDAGRLNEDKGLPLFLQLVQWTSHLDGARLKDVEADVLNALSTYFYDDFTGSGWDPFWPSDVTNNWTFESSFDWIKATADGLSVIRDNIFGNFDFQMKIKHINNNRTLGFWLRDTNNNDLRFFFNHPKLENDRPGESDVRRDIPDLEWLRLTRVDGLIRFWYRLEDSATWVEFSKYEGPHFQDDDDPITLKFDNAINNKVLEVRFAAEAGLDKIIHRPEFVGCEVVEGMQGGAEESAHVLLSWQPVSPAVEYELEFATTADFSDAQVIFSGSGTEFTHDNPPINKMLYYRVRVLPEGLGPVLWSRQCTALVKVTGEADLVAARERIPDDPVQALDLWRRYYDGENPQPFLIPSPMADMRLEEDEDPSDRILLEVFVPSPNPSLSGVGDFSLLARKSFRLLEPPDTDTWDEVLAFPDKDPEVDFADTDPRGDEEIPHCPPVSDLLALAVSQWIEDKIDRLPEGASGLLRATRLGGFPGLPRFHYRELKPRFKKDAGVEGEIESLDPALPIRPDLRFEVVTQAEFDFDDQLNMGPDYMAGRVHYVPMAEDVSDPVLQEQLTQLANEIVLIERDKVAPAKSVFDDVREELEKATDHWQFAYLLKPEDLGRLRDDVNALDGQIEEIEAEEFGISVLIAARENLNELELGFSALDAARGPDDIVEAMEETLNAARVMRVALIDVLSPSIIVIETLDHIILYLEDAIANGPGPDYVRLQNSNEDSVASIVAGLYFYAIIPRWEAEEDLITVLNAALSGNELGEDKDAILEAKNDLVDLNEAIDERKAAPPALGKILATWEKLRALLHNRFINEKGDPIEGNGPQPFREFWVSVEEELESNEQATQDLVARISRVSNAHDKLETADDVREFESLVSELRVTGTLQEPLLRILDTGLTLVERKNAINLEGRRGELKNLVNVFNQNFNDFEISLTSGEFRDKLEMFGDDTITLEDLNPLFIEFSGVIERVNNLLRDLINYEPAGLDLLGSLFLNATGQDNFRIQPREVAALKRLRKAFGNFKNQFNIQASIFFIAARNDKLGELAQELQDLFSPDASPIGPLFILRDNEETTRRALELAQKDFQDASRTYLSLVEKHKVLCRELQEKRDIFSGSSIGLSVKLAGREAGYLHESRRSGNHTRRWVETIRDTVFNDVSLDEASRFEPSFLLPKPRKLEWADPVARDTLNPILPPRAIQFFTAGRPGALFRWRQAMLLELRGTEDDSVDFKVARTGSFAMEMRHPRPAPIPQRLFPFGPNAKREANDCDAVPATCDFEPILDIEAPFRAFRVEWQDPIFNRRLLSAPQELEQKGVKAVLDRKVYGGVDVFYPEIRIRYREVAHLEGRWTVRLNVSLQRPKPNGTFQLIEKKDYELVPIWENSPIDSPMDDLETSFFLYPLKADGTRGDPLDAPISLPQYEIDENLNVDPAEFTDAERRDRLVQVAVLELGIRQPLALDGVFGTSSLKNLDEIHFSYTFIPDEEVVDEQTQPFGEELRATVRTDIDVWPQPQAAYGVRRFPLLEGQTLPRPPFPSRGEIAAFGWLPTPLVIKRGDRFIPSSWEGAFVYKDVFLADEAFLSDDDNTYAYEVFTITTYGEQMEPSEDTFIPTLERSPFEPETNPVGGGP